MTPTENPSGLDDFGHGGPPDSRPTGPGVRTSDAHPSGGGAQSGGASGVGAAASGTSDPPAHPGVDDAEVRPPRPGSATHPPAHGTPENETPESGTPGNRPAQPGQAADEPAELTMLGTAGPVLLRRFGPAVLAGLGLAGLVLRRIRR